MTHRPEEYKHIRAWGRMLHSDASYIREQQERAAKDGVALDAIYLKHGYDSKGNPLPHHWNFYSNVANPETRLLMDRILKEAK